MGHRITYYEDLEWNKTIGFAIAARRVDLRLSKSALARQVEVSVTTIAQLEAGKTGVGSHILYRIARVLRCDMGYFYSQIREAESVTF